nr:MAG TPA: hypothetical protein [Caudoviricetes sp.]
MILCICRTKYRFHAQYPGCGAVYFVNLFN